MTTAYIAFYAKVEASSAEALTALLLNDLPEQTDTVYLLLCTPGGSVSHGIALYNMLRALPYKIITHNIANADSIGNVLFLAGEERYVCESATFLIHKISSPQDDSKIDQSFLREKLSCFEADEHRVRRIVCGRTRMTDECLTAHYTNGTCVTAEESVQNGFSHAVREVKIPKGGTFFVVQASSAEVPTAKK